MSVSHPLPDAASVTPDARTIREAAQWLARLQDGAADPAEQAAFLAWRQAHPSHARAWQAAEQLRQKFQAVTPALGVPVLTRDADLGRRNALRSLALLAGVAAPCAWIAWRHEPWQRWTADYATATGEQRRITLADGSQVLMNTGSRLDVAFNGTQRLLLLRAGQILVQTAPDPGLERPFIVQTEHGSMRALGTRFTVRLMDSAPATPVSGTIHALHGLPCTQLAVQEHAVALTLSGQPDAAPRIVHSGQQLQFDGQQAAPLQPLSQQDQGWIHGVLYASDMRLDDFLRELSRYRPGLLRCDPGVAALRLSGAFQLSDTDRILHGLSATLPVRVTSRTRYWVTVESAKA